MSAAAKFSINVAFHGLPMHSNRLPSAPAESNTLTLPDPVCRPMLGAFVYKTRAFWVDREIQSPHATNNAPGRRSPNQQIG